MVNPRLSRASPGRRRPPPPFVSRCAPASGGSPYTAASTAAMEPAGMPSAARASEFGSLPASSPAAAPGWPAAWASRWSASHAHGQKGFHPLGRYVPSSQSTPAANCGEGKGAVEEWAAGHWVSPCTHAPRPSSAPCCRPPPAQGTFKRSCSICLASATSASATSGSTWASRYWRLSARPTCGGGGARGVAWARQPGAPDSARWAQWWDPGEGRMPSYPAAMVLTHLCGVGTVTGWSARSQRWSQRSRQRMGRHASRLPGRRPLLGCQAPAQQSRLAAGCSTGLLAPLAPLAA